ncbi:hypothetical protein INS49_005769 [Diaporthe citri]|uniref:uncharacterized protein n=1 Tax=Diaporthe citri TaxID=83186 RepID=UPI001C80F7FD|nr:uncharacterized protein INS49_005769 [Diaporthe citri]KAG6364171.1 hypothetical protein INS49_005769 [Diaporthe citri]
MDDTNNIQPDKQGGWPADREHLRKLCAVDVKEKLKGSRYSYVAEELLESLCCVQLDKIDVDIDLSECTTATTYFQPSRPIDEELKQRLSRHQWDLGYPGQAPRLYPECKGNWFTGPWDEAKLRKRGELEIDRFGGSAWRCLEDRCYVRDATGLVLPAGFIWHTHEYSSDYAFFPKDEKKPHLACIISDTLISPDSILRSEIHGAYYLVTYQMVIKRFCNHRIKPVMLYTFQGDDYARITQAYYDPDMGKIIIRQSRQLDLRGPKPTEDAWLLMRWMLNTPAGDTLKSEDDGLPVRVKEPAASPQNPTTVATA